MTVTDFLNATPRLSCGTVGDDCTVALQYGTTSGQVTWLGSLVDSNQGATLIESESAGAAITGTLKKQ